MMKTIGLSDILDFMVPGTSPSEEAMRRLEETMENSLPAKGFSVHLTEDYLTPSVKKHD